MNRQMIAYCWLFVMLLGATSLRARAQSNAVPGEVLARMAENNQKLKPYVHLRKTDVSWNGKLRRTLFAEISNDASTGKEISLPLGSPDSGQSQPAQGFVAMRISQHIANKVRDDVQRLSELRGRYLPLNPDKIQTALGKAQVNSTSSATKIIFTDYVQRGDTMIWSINPNMNVPSHIEIHSSIDDHPVTFSVDFAALPNGICYPASASMEWEAKHLELHISNFEYRK